MFFSLQLKITRRIMTSNICNYFIASREGFATTDMDKCLLQEIHYMLMSSLR